MQGTSAYLEYIGPHGRKRKNKCIYYENKICYNHKNQTYMDKCVGRMFCSCYNDNEKNNLFKNETKNNLLNKKVTLFNITYNEWLNILIVKDEDRDEFDNKISIDSPLGKLLIGARVGEIIEVNQGSINVRYRIKSIR